MIIRLLLQSMLNQFPAQINEAFGTMGDPVDSNAPTPNVDDAPVRESKKERFLDETASRDAMKKSKSSTPKTAILFKR